MERESEGWLELVRCAQSNADDASAKVAMNTNALDATLSTCNQA